MRNLIQRRALWIEVSVLLIEARSAAPASAVDRRDLHLRARRAPARLRLTEILVHRIDVVDTHRPAVDLRIEPLHLLLQRLLLLLHLPLDTSIVCLDVVEEETITPGETLSVHSRRDPCHHPNRQNP